MEILYSDDFICIVNKPSGYVVHKTRGSGDSPLVLQTLRDQLGKKIFPIHRLDRGTSGILAVALSSEIAAQLQTSLSEGTKKYQALCLGHPNAEGVYDRELTGENKEKQKAITKYKVIKKFEKYSLVELEILTGRKHQIRRHLSHEGHHIIGDVNHGKGWLNRRFRENFEFHRIFLHCHFSSLLHPVTGERLNIHCDLTYELRSLLEKLF